MTSYNMDVEQFIGEVRKYPELWNSSTEDSRFPTRRARAWTHVATVFIPDFHNFSALEKKNVYRNFQNKWRNIRDCYVRNLRQSSTRKKGYIYEKLLSFLDEIYQKNQSGNENEHEADQNEAEDASSNDGEDSLQVLLKSELEAEPLARPAPKRKRAKHEAEIHFVDSNFPEAACSFDRKEDVEDDDRSFFLSLVPAVRDFDMDKKLEFRCDVLKLIRKYRHQNRIKEEEA